MIEVFGTHDLPKPRPNPFLALPDRSLEKIDALVRQQLAEYKFKQRRFQRGLRHGDGLAHESGFACALLVCDAPKLLAIRMAKANRQTLAVVLRQSQSP